MQISRGCPLLFAALAVVIATLPGGAARAQAPFGQTLVSALTTETVLLDIDQTVLHTWTGASGPAEIAYLLDDMSILRPTRDVNGWFPAGGVGGRIQRIDASNTVVWDFVFSTIDYAQHHDVQPLPNGNVLLVAWERKSPGEALDAGRAFVNDDLWFTLIVEVEPVGLTGGNIVWEWHLWDHLIQDHDSDRANFGIVADHPQLVDINLGPPAGSWAHVNSIDYHAELDQIVMSSRSMSEVFVIDHSTTTAEAAGHTGGNRGRGGDLLYRWGNPQNYRRGTASDRVFFGVHGANWVDPGLPGAGNILVLNNGDRAGGQNDISSLEELTPPIDAAGNYALTPGSAYGPADLTWTYAAGTAFFTSVRGGAYRLPNGNTLGCEGNEGRIFEVTPEGTVVWQHFAATAVHRAPRYWNHPTAAAEPLAAGATLRGNRPNPFNPTTVLAFELSRPGAVRLEILDRAGRRVSVLHDGTLESGHHEVVWSGRDADGRSVASGVYFARLTAPGTRSTQKLVLAR